MRVVSIYELGQAIGKYVTKKALIPDKVEFLAYGAEILLGCIIKISILFFVAAVLGIIYEVAVLLIVTGFVRILSGGAHCSAYYRCLILSVIVLNVLGYTLKNMYPVFQSLPTVVFVGVIALTVYLYWCYAPQAPVNKPFESKAKEFIFRRYTLFLVVALSFISIILGADGFISWIVASALLWQAFTLTSVGHRFIGLLDSLLDFKEKEGEAECGSL